jgi:hypothetical protein
MTGADLTGANLTGTNFSRSDMRGVVGASLSAAITRSAILPDGIVHGNNWEPGLGVTFRNTSQNIPVRIVEQWVPNAGWTNFALDNQPWRSTITFDPGITVTLGGELVLSLADGQSPASMAGRTYKLFDWSGVTPNGRFSKITDNIHGTSYYTLDTSQFYTTGEVSFVSIVPEPSTVGLLGLAALNLVIYRHFRRRRACHGCLAAARETTRRDGRHNCRRRPVDGAMRNA